MARSIHSWGFKAVPGKEPVGPPDSVFHVALPIYIRVYIFLHVHIIKAILIKYQP